MACTFLIGTRDLLVHALAVGLTTALLGFVMYLIFALEHPYLGALSVQPTAYVNVLQSFRPGPTKRLTRSARRSVEAQPAIRSRS